MQPPENPRQILPPLEQKPKTPGGRVETAFRELVSKAAVASVVSAVVILGGLVYAIQTRNTDLVTFMVGAAVGYLYGKRAAP
jgi:hypothetical protein